MKLSIFSVWAVISLLSASILNCSKSTTDNNIGQFPAQMSQFPEGVTASNPAQETPGNDGILPQGIIARKSAWLRHHTQINTNVYVLGNCVGQGCLDPATAPSNPKHINNADSELTVGVSVTVPVGRVLKADKIRLKERANVQGTTEANTFAQAKSAVIANKVSPLGSLPNLPFFLSGTPGAQNVNDAASPLAAGRYNNLTVRKDKILVLSGGFYQLNDIDLKKDSSLLCATQCFVTAKVDLISEKKITLAAISSNPNDFLLYIEGGSAAAQPMENSAKAVQLGGMSQITANIYAPNGRLQFGAATIAKGVFIGNHVRIEPNSVITAGPAPTGVVKLFEAGVADSIEIPGKVRLDVPANALVEDTVIAIQEKGPITADKPRSPAQLRFVGEAFEFQPDGLQFTENYVLTMNYDPAQVSAIGVTPSNLWVYSAASDAAQFSPSVSVAVDAAQKIQAKDNHFTVFVLGSVGVGGATTGLNISGDNVIPVIPQTPRIRFTIADKNQIPALGSVDPTRYAYYHTGDNVVLVNGDMFYYYQQVGACIMDSVQRVGTTIWDEKGVVFTRNFPSGVPMTLSPVPNLIANGIVFTLANYGAVFDFASTGPVGDCVLSPEMFQFLYAYNFSAGSGPAVYFSNKMWSAGRAGAYGLLSSLLNQDLLTYHGEPIQFSTQYFNRIMPFKSHLIMAAWANGQPTLRTYDPGTGNEYFHPTGSLNTTYEIVTTGNVAYALQAGGIGAIVEMDMTDPTSAQPPLSSISVAPDTFHMAQSGNYLVVAEGTFSTPSLRLINIGFPVGGTVTGLPSGGTVELVNNVTTGQPPKTVISGNGSYQNAELIADGNSYNFVVASQPAGYVCTVSNGGGVMDFHGAPVNVNVGCSKIPTAWYPAGNLNIGRMDHSATLLLDGRVLIIGGRDANSNLIPIAESYNVTSKTFTVIGPMITPRMGHSATLLSDGRVLIVGGVIDTWTGIGTSSAEIFEPTTNTFIAVGASNRVAVNHTANTLPNGKILISGGGDNLAPSNQTDIFDPSTNSFIPGPTMNSAHFYSATQFLAGGRLLISGGSANDIVTAQSEIYDFTTNTWLVTGSLNQGRMAHAAVSLANGNVLVTGGLYNSTVFSSTEIFDAATGVYKAGPNLSQARFYAQAVRGYDGRVYVMGGNYAGITLTSVEIFSEDGSTIVAGPNLIQPRNFYSATALPSGAILLVGGISGSNALKSAEILQ
ncbi:MAG: kelch repeat-containing protein [Turneriella sp.]